MPKVLLSGQFLGGAMGEVEGLACSGPGTVATTSSVLRHRGERGTVEADRNRKRNIWIAWGILGAGVLVSIGMYMLA